MYCEKPILDICFKQLRKQAESLLLVSKGIDITICEHKKKRTRDQNNYYWELCEDIAKFLDNAGCYYGEYKLPYKKDYIHDINKAVLGIDSTKKMDIKTFCEYITRVTIFWEEKTKKFWHPSELPEGYFLKKGYSEKDFM